MSEVEDTAASRPSLEAMLERVPHLTAAEARELAELDRVPDWTDHRRPGVYGPAFLALFSDLLARGSGTRSFGRPIGAEATFRRQAAVKQTKRLLGPETSTVLGRARVALAAADPSWPGRRLADAMAVVAFGSTIVIAVAVLAVVLTRPDSYGWLFLGFVVGALPWLAMDLLPPGRRHLRRTIETTALAHAVADRLSDDEFDALTGGWYAVLGGKWRRGPRPYFLWGCLIVGIGLLIVFGYFVNVVYEQLYPGQA